MSKKYYMFNFAYGSNMMWQRLQQRVPSAQVVEVGRLPHHLLKWNKRSIDGSGKCDAEYTGKHTDVVWGVLFRFEVSEKSSLDDAEGLNNGYAEKEVEILTTQGNRTAKMYFATIKDLKLKPYHWYKAYVVQGAYDNKLPPEYIDFLKSVVSIPDPDAMRSARNAKILASSTDLR